jgi:hypothetical protein
MSEPLTPEQWARVATAILITLREGNSESTVEWNFNSQFEDIRKLERETFLSDLKRRLAHPDLKLY